MKRDMTRARKSRVKGMRVFGLMLVASCLATAGCVTYNSAVPASTGVGAGAGALLGYGLTGDGYGAAAGAGAGALAGALTGIVIDETRRPRTAPPPQTYQAPVKYTSTAPAYTSRPDPTMGELFNDTPWRLEVFVDHSPGPLFLSAREVTPVNLDIGDHQVKAVAYVSTQFGERLIGTFHHSIYVDPRGSGWGLRFDEAMF